MGHIIVSSLAAVRGLPKLWLSPVAAIPQIGRQLRLIFDFIWSVLTKAKSREAPEEVMRFGGTLCHIILRVILSDPWLDPVYLGKLDLANA